MMIYVKVLLNEVNLFVINFIKKLLNRVSKKPENLEKPGIFNNFNVLSSIMTI